MSSTQLQYPSVNSQYLSAYLLCFFIFIELVNFSFQGSYKIISVILGYIMFQAFNVLRYEIGQKYNSHYDAFDPAEYGPQKSQRVHTAHKSIISFRHMVS